MGWSKSQKTNAKGMSASGRQQARKTPSAPEAASPATAARGPQGDGLHREDTLRQTATHLVANGDLDLNLDGQVRPERVDVVRANLGNGTYSRRDVIAGIVDRLLEQWRI